MIIAVITNAKDEVIAISEDTGVAKDFYEQNNMSYPDFNITSITKKSKCNKMLIMYEDMYLEEYENFIIRRCDEMAFNDMLTKYIDGIGDACKTIIHVLPDMPKFSEKNRKDLIKLLMKLWDNIPYINTTEHINTYYESIGLRHKK